MRVRVKVFQLDLEPRKLGITNNSTNDEIAKVLGNRVVNGGRFPDGVFSVFNNRAAYRRDGETLLIDVRWTYMWRIASRFATELREEVVEVEVEVEEERLSRTTNPAGKS